MDIGELHHLLFRWLHVMSAVLWIGHLWSLVFVQNVPRPEPDVWMRASGSARQPMPRRPSLWSCFPSSPGGWLNS